MLSGSGGAEPPSPAGPGMFQRTRGQRDAGRAPAASFDGSASSPQSSQSPKAAGLLTPGSSQGFLARCAPMPSFDGCVLLPFLSNALAVAAAGRSDGRPRPPTL